MVKEGEEEERHVIMGRYEMGRLLGKGTFGKVYHGRDISSDKSVAIKTINIDQVKKVKGMMDQIQREISIMRIVQHPNVVELKEVMATKTRIFFVMEYVRGGELFAKVEHGRLSEDEARHYFRQLISAVDFCHSRGVTHRDLKPENLLLDEFGHLKVSDFGLSALPEQHRQDGLLHTQCGTPAYVAPEVLRNKGYDGTQTDVWSCGVILFVLLTGHLPFQHENMMKMYQKIFKGEYQMPPWVSGDAKKLIAKMLAVDPKKRIPLGDIIRDPWFKKGRLRSIANVGALQVSPKDDTDKEQDGNEQSNNKTEILLSPRSYNAFQLISSMSSGFDLSSLFEIQRPKSTIFTSKAPAEKIITTLEKVGNTLGFTIKRGKKEGYGVRLECKEEGRKGKLVINAEVFEAAPEMAVVEFGKCSGDTLEYNKFCAEDVRPGLKDVVWAWQGENEERFKA